MQELCCQELDLHWLSLVDSILLYFLFSCVLIFCQIVCLLIIISNIKPWLEPYWQDVHPPWSLGHPSSISMYCVHLFM